VKDSGRGTAERAWRRYQRRFDANFVARTNLIETVICYPFFCEGGIRNLSRHAASTRELKGSLRRVSQFARSQYVVNYIAEEAIYRGFLRTI
jgi:hypothetical protein